MAGSIFGGIVGDAYGGPYEFKRRNKYDISPNMEYNQNFGIPAGSFTDDSSMMLCLAASLLEKKTFDPMDQMTKYLKWIQEAYMSSVPSYGCFGLGSQTCQALTRFQWEEYKDLRPYVGPTEEKYSGNGGIMRLAPVPVLCYKFEDQAAKYSRLSSRTTHGSDDCMDSAEYMGRIISRLIKGYQKEEALFNIESDTIRSQKVKSIMMGSFRNKKEHEIQTTGYVIHTLEAALWAFWRYQNFEDGMLKLAKMGDDVDTVCSVYGQIAGAYYGYNDIPQRWTQKLQRLELINETTQGLIRMSQDIEKQL